MTGPTLTAPFKNTSELTKGGRTFTYIPAAEVIERLNAVLGYGNWSYHCQLVHLDGDFAVVHGTLQALGATFEQFGGQRLNKNKQGEVIDLGDDLKGAASDAQKKCAAMIGVGLYLSLGRGPTPALQTSSGDDQGEERLRLSPSSSSQRETSAVPTGDPSGEEAPAQGPSASSPAPSGRPYTADKPLAEARAAVRGKK